MHNALQTLPILTYPFLQLPRTQLPHVPFVHVRVPYCDSDEQSLVEPFGEHEPDFGSHTLPQKNGDVIASKQLHSRFHTSSFIVPQKYSRIFVVSSLHGHTTDEPVYIVLLATPSHSIFEPEPAGVPDI